MPFDWKTFGDEVVDVFKTAIARAIEPLTARLDALEQRKPERGEKGDPGEQGKQGEKGPEGPQGKQGPVGEKGGRGDAGSPGEKGPVGEQGKDGTPGRDGRDGPPGRDGADGKPGLDGKDGAAGVNGKDGQDGLGFDDIEVQHDGERGFKFVFIRGEKRKEFGAFTIPSMIYRGVWTEGEFKKGDVVTLAGSMFVAKEDTATKPETKDCGWQLATKRGKDGRDGKDGKLGERGIQGPPGRDGRVYA